MGCGCGGGRRSRSSVGGSFHFGSSSTPQEWVVTYTEGGRSQTKIFNTDTEAYQFVRARGGGIQQRDRA